MAPQAKREARARAHPNIALIKYWGKADGVDNVPAVPSLSVTLNDLATETSVAVTGSADRFVLNGDERDDAKLAGFLTRLRRDLELPPLLIDTSNNFPTAAGLASSASGFAALVTAINAACDLNWNTRELSFWARVGSGSAPRSLFGPMAQITAPAFEAEAVDASSLPELSVVVAITSKAEKTTSSSAGMKASKDTSPFYQAWVDSAGADLSQAQAAIAAGDFDALARAANHSCMKMHAVMLSTRPTLRYWNSATVACLEAVDALAAKGTSVFASIDAGPQIKAVCQRDVAEQVAGTLDAIDGVLHTQTVSLGPGAHLQ